MRQRRVHPKNARLELPPHWPALPPNVFGCFSVATSRKLWHPPGKEKRALARMGVAQAPFVSWIRCNTKCSPSLQRGSPALVGRSGSIFHIAEHATQTTLEHRDVFGGQSHNRRRL